MWQSRLRNLLIPLRHFGLNPEYVKLEIKNLWITLLSKFVDLIHAVLGGAQCD